MIEDRQAIRALSSSERRPWPSVMLVWMGSMICIPSILVGSDLALGLGFISALIAGIIGYLAILLVTILQGMQASDLGLPTVVLAKPSFGSGMANYLFSFIVAIALVGWYGIQASIAGESFYQLLASLDLDIPKALATLVMSLLMLSSAVFGFTAMENLNRLAVPLLVLVLVWASISAAMTSDLSQILAYRPRAGASLSFVSAIAMVFGSFVVGGVISGDYTRFNRNRKDTVKAASLGIVPAGLLLILIGAFLALTSNGGDITSILTDHIPMPALALIALILATWTTNVSNAYSAGVAMVNGLRLPMSARGLVTGIAGVIGTALSLLGILDNFVIFLSVLTSLITPIAGVMIADYWCLNRGRAKDYMSQSASPWVGLVAWLLGSIPGILTLFFQNLPDLLQASCAFSGIFIALIVYLVFKGGKYDNITHD